MKDNKTVKNILRIFNKETLKSVVKKGQDLFQKHQKKIIVSFIFIVGLLLIMSYPRFGGFILGGLSGLVLSKEYVKFYHKVKQFYIKRSLFKSFAITISCLAILILAPTLTLGAAVGVGLRVLFEPSKHSHA